MKTNLPDGEITLEVLDATFGVKALDDILYERCEHNDIRAKDVRLLFDPWEDAGDRKHFFAKQTFEIAGGYLMIEDRYSRYAWDGGEWMDEHTFRENHPEIDDE